MTINSILSQLLSEGVSAADIPKLAKEAASFLDGELTKMFPSDKWEVNVDYTERLGRSINVKVYSKFPASYKVTPMNSASSVVTMMYLSSNGGKDIDFEKVSFDGDKGRANGKPMTVRKISDATIMGASKKLLAFFKKNEDALKAWDLNESAESEELCLDMLYDDDFNALYEDFHNVTSLISEKRATAPKTRQIWGDHEPKNSNDAGRVYQAARKLANQMKDEFLGKLKTAAKKAHQPKVLVDVKSGESFIDKVIKRGKDASKITDVLRSAILLGTEEDVKMVVDQVKKDFTVVEYEYKSKDGDKEFGYFGSHHFLVKIGEIIAEIQVMTKKLWSYKEEAHKIYNKYRSEKEASGEFEKLDKELSKKIFQMGNSPRR